MRTKIRGMRVGGSGEEVDIKASRDGDLRVARYLPPYAMLCAAGKLFAFDISGATAKAPVAAMPVESPEWMLYNANPVGGNHIVLLHVGCAYSGGSQGLGVAVVGATGIGNQTAQVAKYSNADVSCLDGTAKMPNVFLANNKDIIGTQPAWVLLDAQDTTIGTKIGSGTTASKIEGKLIAPPKGAIYLEIVGAGGTSSVIDITIIIAELMLDTA